MGLDVFVVSTLSLSHVIGFYNGLLTPASGALINFLYDDSLLSTNFASSDQKSTTKFSETLPP